MSTHRAEIVTLHASPRVTRHHDASDTASPQVVTHVTRKTHITRTQGVTRVTRTPMFDPTRTRTYTREQTNHE